MLTDVSVIINDDQPRERKVLLLYNNDPPGQKARIVTVSNVVATYHFIIIT